MVCLRGGQGGIFHIMPRKKDTSRAANGVGSIRKITSTRNGKKYTYWQARYTAGYDLGSGKQIQRSITGKSQKEVAEKLKAATAALDEGTYIAPNKQTLGEWLDTWAETYLLNVKPRTLAVYQSDIRLHIKPALGAVRLDALDAPMIQAFYRRLMQPSAKKAGLSAKTIKNIHGVLHKSLQQAVLVGYLHFNPCDACVLPHVCRSEIHPFDDVQISAFLVVIRGSRFEMLFLLTLFTGMRQGEVLGLTWDCVDFERGLIIINKQLQLHQERGCKDAYTLASPKNGKFRSVMPAPSVMAALKRYRSIQAQQRLEAGPAWDNPYNLVFTTSLGHHLSKPSVYREFKRIAAAIGRPDARFHDLRHSFAVASLRAGDDPKTVQSNLGHATAAFTLDVYGHMTDQMKQASSARMEAFIKGLSAM